ncbi:MAG TPA: hypothetical protein VL738_06325 [Dactylosporangium sp.]|nr:hypothetical protein [Dactylosporangium sp.]
MACEVAAVEPALPDVEARMRLAHRLARRNHLEGTGGPFAGEGDEVEHLTGFDEGPMRPDRKEQLAARGVEVRTDVLRAEALATFREYGERPDVIVYNGGGRGRSTPAAPQVR